MKLTQGIWMVGEFDGSSERTITPSTESGAKQFKPFTVESVRLIVNDDTRYVEWREGRRPPVEDLVEGELVVVPVRPGRIVNGSPQWEGRPVPILANE